MGVPPITSGKKSGMDTTTHPPANGKRKPRADAIRNRERVLEAAKAVIAMDTRWQITLLGALRAEREGTILSQFRSQKTGVLLGYLAYFSHRTHLRDALIELLWPDADLSAARASLSVSLSFLRQRLEPPGSAPGSVLIADRSTVRLNPEAIHTDAAAFEAGGARVPAAGSPTGAPK